MGNKAQRGITKATQATMPRNAPGSPFDPKHKDKGKKGKSKEIDATRPPTWPVIADTEKVLSFNYEDPPGKEAYPAYIMCNGKKYVPSTEQ